MLEILVAAFANILTRFLPFVFFKKHAKKFVFLKDDLPIALLTILTLYVIFQKSVDFYILEYRLLSIVMTIIIHIIFRKFLLSIFIGSLFYIYLIN